MGADGCSAEPGSNLKSGLEAAVCAVSFHNGTKPAKLRAPYKVYNFP